MLKITIEVKENKGEKSCKVTKMINPKDTTKATDAEKNCCAMVITKLKKSLKEIQD